MAVSSKEVGEGATGEIIEWPLATVSSQKAKNF